MNTFVMHLYGSTQYEKIEGITTFVEQDDSGSFGIQAGHARMMTALSYGLARYCDTNNLWVYLALPGGLLYFVNNELHITTRRYFVDTDYQRISTTLLDQLLREEEELYLVKQTLSRLEQETLRRLWQIEQGVT
jgi:F-type H+-transporting ATPase subunit epsilon